MDSVRTTECVDRWAIKINSYRHLALSFKPSIELTPSGCSIKTSSLNEYMNEWMFARGLKLWQSEFGSEGCLLEFEEEEEHGNSLVLKASGCAVGGWVSWRWAGVLLEGAGVLQLQDISSITQVVEICLLVQGPCWASAGFAMEVKTERPK